MFRSGSIAARRAHTSKLSAASAVATSVRQVIEQLEARRLLCVDGRIPFAENPKNFPATVIDVNNKQQVAQFKRTMVNASPTPMTQAPVQYSANAAELAKQVASLLGGAELVASGGKKGVVSRGNSQDADSLPTLNAGGHGTADVAPISWVNRAVTTGANNDRFNDVFGASANTARAVMDAAINMWARVIGNFNYAGGFAGSTYQLTVKMATGSTGNGASAGVSTYATNKPLSGAITMGSGGNGLGSGWFIDPTPYDNSEFMGTIDNAFAMETQSGSAASGKGDFLTVALAEMAHCMGLFTSPSALQTVVTNTGVNDAAGGASGAKLFVESSANIKHLMTAFNSGSPQNFNAAIHTAEPQALTYGGLGYNGTDDAGNAYYSFNQRCLVPENLRLIFNDSLGYGTVPAATFASAYATLDASGVMQIRGGSGVSSDVVVLSVVGTDLVVDVDVGADVAGSGNLPGAGNLGAWRTVVPLSSVSSINVVGGDGNDFLRVEGNGGKTVYLDGGNGDDYFDFDYYSRNLGNTPSGFISVSGGAGAGDRVWVYDDGVNIAQTYTITSARFDRPGWAGFSYASDIEGLTLTTSLAADTVNIPSTYVNQPIYLFSGGGGDVVNIGNTTNGVQSIAAFVQIENNPSFSTININDTGDTTARSPLVSNAGGNFEAVYYLAPQPIYFDRADVAAVNVTTGGGADVVTIAQNSETFNVSNSNGAGDTVKLGDDSFFVNRGLDAMTGNVTITNPPAFTTILITDQYGSAARTATWTVASGFTTITGLQPIGTISYKAFDTASVNLLGGGLADTYTFTDFTNPTTVSSGLGNDVLNVNGIASGYSLNLDSGADDDTININETTTFAPVTVNTGAGTLDMLNINADGVGAAVAQMTASDSVRYLSLGAAGRLSLISGRDKALSFDNASISGVLDLNDNGLICTTAIGTPSETFFRNRLIAGRNGGAWNGAQPAFVSTTAAGSAANDGIGYGYAGNGVSLTSLYGLPIATGYMVLRYGLTGDADLSGTVDFADLLTLAQNFGASPRDYAHGDFDYSGTVDFADLLALAQNFGGNTLIADATSLFPTTVVDELKARSPRFGGRPGSIFADDGRLDVAPTNRKNSGSGSTTAVS